MPSTVADGAPTADRRRGRSPISLTPSSTFASARNCSAGYSTPVHVCDASRPSTVVSCTSCSVDRSLDQGDDGREQAPEHARVHRAAQRAERDVDAGHAAQRRVSVGTPTAKLPVSTTRIVSARRSIPRLGDRTPPARRSPAPPSLRRSPYAARELPVTSPAAPQRREVHDDVALAVGPPRPYQRPSALVSSQHRAVQVLAERPLHVVVRVEHTVGVPGGRRAAVHRLAAVGRRRGRERPGGRPREASITHCAALVALLGRVLLRVGDRPKERARRGRPWRGP